MNKSELIQMLSNRTKMSKADATRAVEALFNPDDGIIPATLRDGDRVQITGFGTFETRERKARTGRNPRTGKEIRIGPTTSASFRPGKALKDSVKPSDDNGGGQL
jgi:DNA-binding protein HU-beta